MGTGSRRVFSVGVSGSASAYGSCADPLCGLAKGLGQSLDWYLFYHLLNYTLHQLPRSGLFQVVNHANPWRGVCAGSRDSPHRSTGLEPAAASSPAVAGVVGHGPWSTDESRLSFQRVGFILEPFVFLKES